jgi:hypothetical protein
LSFEVKCLRRSGDRGRVNEVGNKSLEELDEGFTNSAWDI